MEAAHALPASSVQTYGVGVFDVASKFSEEQLVLTLQTFEKTQGTPTVPSSCDTSGIHHPDKVFANLLQKSRSLPPHLPKIVRADFLLLLTKNNSKLIIPFLLGEEPVCQERVTPGAMYSVAIRTPVLRKHVC
jgi:hypothetical protein